tara:strand:- start:20978 stop:23125 length:2148 start_codon:yes stop_codon:yes gene_type:complete
MAQLPNYPGLVRDASGRLSMGPPTQIGVDEQDKPVYETQQDVLARAYEQNLQANRPLGDLGGGATITKQETEVDGNPLTNYVLGYNAPQPAPQPVPQPVTQPAPQPAPQPVTQPTLPSTGPFTEPMIRPAEPPGLITDRADYDPVTGLYSFPSDRDIRDFFPSPTDDRNMDKLTPFQRPLVDPVFDQFTGPRTNFEKAPPTEDRKYFRQELTPEFKEFLTQRGYTVSQLEGLADGPDIIFNPQGQRVTFGAQTAVNPNPTGPAVPAPPIGLETRTIGQTAAQAGVGSVPTDLPAGTAIDPDDLVIKEDELFAEIRSADPIEGEAATLLTAATTGLEIATPPRTNAQTYSSYVQEGTPEYIAAQGQPSSESLIGDIQGAVSQQAIATAATEELDERATIKYQMDQLFDSFEEGKPPPAWAAPAVRNAGAMMAQRGMGRSSMAAAAITQAMMESGISIAKEDANKYATIQIANLRNKQQTALQNALTFAAMDKANLDARMTAAVNNARAFLQMDTANLNNQQQLKTIDLQSQFQKMFNDQAQENASRQFNAKSQMQVDQFFSELEVQVANANSSRMAAMNQFNADQINAGKRYFAKMNDARERFNIQNESIIQQSNASWRRSINTANTTQQNEANRVNALNLLGFTQTAMDKLWQRYRDEAGWAMQISENDKQRAHNIAILAQQQTFDANQYEKDRDTAFYDSLGSTVVNGIFGILD